VQKAEKAAGRTVTPRYVLAETLFDRPGTDHGPREMRWRTVVAPIPKFFHSWTDGRTAPPDDLARHVVAHRVSPKHLSRRNALAAQMLVASLLRESQHWAALVQDDQDMTLHDLDQPAGIAVDG
jgi:hypothetical protein